jgi:hypothetical protein
MQPSSTMTLYDDQGNAIVARPFLLTRYGKALLATELYTAQDTRIRCLDPVKGVYRCDESGTLLAPQRRSLDTT